MSAISHFLQKNIDEPQQNSPQKISINSEEDDSNLTWSLSKAFDLRNKFIGIDEIEDDNFTLDSGVWYLTTSLNIDLCNANTYGVDAKYYTHIIDIQDIYSFTESSLNGYFDQIKNIAESNLSTVTEYQDKAIKYLTVHIEEEEITSKRFLIVQLLIGHKNFQESWVTGEQTEYEYFNPSTSYRFNNNGGYCSEAYYAPLDWGVKRFVDIHGDWRGYDYGGANDLEKAINTAYNYEVVRRNGNSSYAYPVGKKPVFISYIRYAQVNTPDVVNSNNTIHPKLNPTNIFSYNDFSMTLNNNLPCITGAQLNFFLGKAIDDILFSSQFAPSISNVFVGCEVRSNYKPVDASVFTTDETQRNAGRYRRISGGTTIYDEFYSHKYNLNSAKVVLVEDPDAL